MLNNSVRLKIGFFQRLDGVVQTDTNAVVAVQRARTPNEQGRQIYPDTPVAPCAGIGQRCTIDLREKLPASVHSSSAANLFSAGYSKLKVGKLISNRHQNKLPCNPLQYSILARKFLT